MQFLEVLGPFPFSFVSFFLNECNVMPTSEKFSILLTFTLSHSKIIPFFFLQSSKSTQWWELS